MEADNFIFNDNNEFGKNMIHRISKEMGITPECIDIAIVTIRYKKSSHKSNKESTESSTEKQ